MLLLPLSLCLWALPTQASQPLPTQMANSSTTAHASIPIYCLYSQQYYVKVANDQGQSAPARVDYLQPDLWVIDGQHLLECDTLLSQLNVVTNTDLLPSQITYDHLTYEALECYWMSAFYPTQIVTTTDGSATTTVMEVQLTGESFILDYANGVSATGVTATANISVPATEDTLVFPDYPYLLATDTNRYIGAMGLALYPHQGGILGALKEQSMISAHSYSVFYFNETAEDTELSGYLLPGFVDKSLYTGDFYSFPMVPFVGWGSFNATAPIISLDSIELEDASSRNKAKVYDEGPLAIAIDPLLDFTYLPLSAIVNIALQTNAFYSTNQGLWVVKCKDIDDSNANINLNIGPLSLQIPLTALLMDRSDWGPLKFSSGESACVLNIFPSDSLGYPSIGSPLLRFIYMAVDNEGRSIALANSDQDLQADDDVGGSSVREISSGHIPFATTHLITSLLETFTFYKQNYTTEGSIPAQFSNIQLNSNGVYITDGFSFSQTNSASAAKAASTSGGAERMASVDGSASLLYLVVLMGTIMGLSFI